MIQVHNIDRGNLQTRTSRAANTLIAADLVLASNTYRQKFCLWNASSTIIFYIAFAATGEARNVSSTSFSFKLSPGDYYEDTNWVGEIHAIASAASADNLIITELY